MTSPDNEAAAPAPAYASVCEGWQQGDYTDAPAYVLDYLWERCQLADTEGIVIVTQTCDVVRTDRDHIQLAPIVRISEDDPTGLFQNAKAGRTPRYFHLPDSGADHFIDLDAITTVHKDALLDLSFKRGASNDKTVRELAFAIARKFGRFPFPNEVNAAFGPLSAAIRGRATSADSPLGKALQKVHSVRVGCEDWNAPPRHITVAIILVANVLPGRDDEEGPEPATLITLHQSETLTLKQRVSEVLDYLNNTAQTPGERYWGWHHLTQYWAAQCMEAAKSSEVASIECTAESEDEYPLSQVNRTEGLDLDYLSDSRKPAT